MCFCKAIKREPERSSGAEKLVKFILVVGALSAIAIAAYVAYRKFNDYMRKLVEENCEDYLDDCCCDCDECDDDDCEDCGCGCGDDVVVDADNADDADEGKTE